MNLLRSVLVAALVLAPTPGHAQTEPTAAQREALVRELLAAFNAQDADAMARLVTPDVSWLSINGAKLSAEASSREELHKGMVSYFKSCPSCRSSLASMMSTPRRVTTVEVARWSVRGEAREQRSVAVYEFAGALINRVYYFPAEP